MASVQLAAARGVVLEWRKPGQDPLRPDRQYWVVRHTAPGDDGISRVTYARGFWTEDAARQAWRRFTSDAQFAKAKGFFVYQGAYLDTPDDRLGRWYVGVVGQMRSPWGAGYRTRREAWAHAADLAEELAR